MSERNDKTDNIELLLDPSESVVPNLPRYVEIDNCYEVKILNIYDPSKFWMVLQDKELKIFMRYLKHIYGNDRNRKIIPRSKLKNHLLCIVNRNNMYYRSVILPVLLPDESLIRVFLIDFGLIVNVSVKDVFYIFRKHGKIPRFSIRASLINIAPSDQSKSWSLSDLKEFCELVDGKELIAKIFEVDMERSILFVDIRILCGNMCKSISGSLVLLGVAAYSKMYDADRTDVAVKYKPKVKYIHLFPTFEALESGQVPCSLWEYDLLKNSVPLDLLYKNYYQYQEANNFENGLDV